MPIPAICNICENSPSGIETRLVIISIRDCYDSVVEVP